MKHLDGETLALLALGDPADDATRAHVARCARCRGEIAQLRGLVDAVRWSGPDPDAPEEAVWDAIRMRIDAGERAPQRDSPTLTPPSAPSPATQSGTGDDHGRRAGSSEGERRGDGRPPTRNDDTGPARRGRRRPGARTWSFLAGVVVAALVIVAVVWGVNARTSDQVVATARLEPIGTEATTGTAELQRASDGTSDLHLQIGADRVRGYTEVWLIAKDGKRMVSLGTLPDGSASLPVPAGLDVRDYATVDISDEPYDGNPAHSGNSILRGPLTF